MKGKKFVASYSGGKDSILSIYRAISGGMIPVALIITYNTDKNRSWFHGIPSNILEKVSESINIPIWIIETNGADYKKNFENALLKARKHMCEVCIFGDIDIEDHRKWCRDVCINSGIEAYFPLWGEVRQDLVYEFLDSGFEATITTVDLNRLSEKFLGQCMTRELVDMIQSEGADICGENGEYHTFVTGGPLFKDNIVIDYGNKIYENNYAILPIK